VHFDAHLFHEKRLKMLKTDAHDLYTLMYALMLKERWKKANKPHSYRLFPLYSLMLFLMLRVTPNG
jgi:hypothetical protein